MSSNAKHALGNEVSVVWLRRDLRLHDHGAMAAAAAYGAPVQPVFILDTEILARFTNPGDRRLTLIARALENIHAGLSKKGGGLLVLHGEAREQMPRLCEALGAARLVTAADYEPATRARDKQVHDALQGKAPMQRVNDHLVFRPDEVLKDDGTPYKVFTPYAAAWRRLLAAKPGAVREQAYDAHYAEYDAMLKLAREAGLKPLNALSAEEMLAAAGYRPAASQWTADGAGAGLAEFVESGMDKYEQRRDVLPLDGTSRLSPYLRFGLLSVRECARAALRGEEEGKAGASTWLKELIWREFFAMILFHWPESATQSFRPEYRGLHWRSSRADFTRWQEGRTGYPVIDAAMRELACTGYMHNRARMIVASFLTKHLLLDWRWGEEHFAQLLMDYELASNVGNWQWAASTGTDAQPYFRIFNPVLQGKKFDPEGEYIARFVPELADLPVPAMHEPWKRGGVKGYPEPIVEHTAVKERVLSLFKAGL